MRGSLAVWSESGGWANYSLVFRIACANIGALVSAAFILA